MDSPKRPDADIVIVGRLTGVHGVRGGMKLLSFTQPREAIFSYRPWFIGRQEREMECVRGRPKGKTLVDRKSTRLNSSHSQQSRMPSSA